MIVSSSDIHKKILLFANNEGAFESIKVRFNQRGWESRNCDFRAKLQQDLLAFEPDMLLCQITSIDDNINQFRDLLENDLFSANGNFPVILLSDTPGRTDPATCEALKKSLAGWYTLPLSEQHLFEIVECFLNQNENLVSSAALTQEIKRSEYRYRDLLENASDFIFTLDEEDNLTYLNNRFQTLTGFQKLDWMNQPFADLIQMESRELVVEQLNKVRAGRSRNFEVQVRNKNNNTVFVFIMLTPIFQRGEIHGAMGIGRDLTQKKQLEKDMHDLESLNESIIQSMESGLLALDLEGKIISLNQGGEKILGWQEADIAGKYLSDLFSETEISQLLSDSAEVAPLTMSQEVKLSVKSGRQLFLGYNRTDWLDNAGDKMGILISFRDISELKRMQSEVLRMDRLASLGVLASGIAHEIKNPLAGIKMMAQACEEEMDSSDERKEYLTRIVGQVDRLDDLLKTFFTFAKPRKPEPKPQKLLTIIEDVSQLVNKNLSYKEIEYIIDIPEILPMVLVDSQQMQQVFLNLILNAVSAMPDGGRLSITATCESEEEPVTTANCEPPNDYVVIHVADTGTGIAEEKIQQVFDPFFTTKADGMGLGLSIVYRIIQEHQGEINVKSSLGEGTCFSLSLPAGGNSVNE